MASREIVGLGALYERDSALHDRCGLFRWKLEIKQVGQRIITDFTVVAGDGDSWYDGWYNLESTVKSNSIKWFCDEAGKVEGLRMMIACVTTAKGKNAGVSVAATGTGSGGTSGGSGGGSLAVTYTPGYSGQRLAWLVKLELCPGKEGCPNVRVLLNSATVSDTEYFWGTWLGPVSNGEFASSAHMPQIMIGECGGELDATADKVMPIDVAGTGTVHTAT